MKRKSFIRTMLVLLSTTVLCACGSDKKNEPISQIFAVRDEVVKSEKDIVIEDEKVATAEQSKEYKIYENDSVQFAYPKAWMLFEQQAEAGRTVILKDGDREVFSIEQGEVALVSIDATEEDYYRKYQGMYPYLDIVGIEEITMDGCEARKLSFTYRKDEMDYTGVKYMLVKDDRAMIFHSDLSNKLIPNYEKEIVSICESVILKETNKAELEQLIYFDKQEYVCEMNQVIEAIDTQSVYLYGLCELGDETIQVYRNTQDYLVIATVNQKGEHTVLACETDQAYLTYESMLKEKEVSTWMTMQEDLFGYPTVLIQVLVGAVATDYYVIGEVDGSYQILFYECESGLKIGDVDGDSVKELISSLDGYFYRYEGGRVCKYTAVLPTTIKQLAWEGKYFSLYQKNGIKKKGELVVQDSGVWSLAEKDYMPIHVFEQQEVAFVPVLAEYTFTQANELGIMTQQSGDLPGFGVWYTVEIDGVVYHYYQNEKQEHASLYSYAIVKDTYSLANGISVGMTEEEILAMYPNMAVMTFRNEYLDEAVTGHQGWNGITYPCITLEEDGVYSTHSWLEQFDYVMIGDINLDETAVQPMYLGLLMKDGKVAAITKYNPTVE